MNLKQLSLLVVLLVVLGGAGLLIQRGHQQTESTGEQGAGRKLLGDKFPLNDVSHIAIKQGTNQVNLVKKDDLWQVRERSDYPANFDQIKEFLIKAADLKVAQSEQVGPSQLARLQLAPPGQGTNAGISVDLQDKSDKTIKAFTLGKPHLRKPTAQAASQFGDSEGYPDGRWVMLAANTHDALLIGDPLNTVEPKPEQWLKKDFFKIERPKSVAVTYTAATNSWKIERDGDAASWKLDDVKPDENVDTNKLTSLANPFASPTINDVLVKSAKPEESGLDKPTVVTVETFDDFTYTVNVGRKSGEDYPLKLTVAANFPKERPVGKDEKPEDKAKADKAWQDREKQLNDKLKETKVYEGWTYLVPAWNIDQILKERKDLLVEKKEEKKDETKSEDKPVAATEQKDDAKPVLKPDSATDKK